VSDDLPRVISSAEFTILGVVLHCHVLSDGQRIIDADDVDKLFSAGAGRPPSLSLDDEQARKFAEWRRG
jgi:hypothetical protein